MSAEIDALKRELKAEIKEVSQKFEKVADKGLIAWASKSYSSWIMLAVVVGLPLIGVVVGYNLK